MILLLIIALSCIVTAGYLMFALPSYQHTQTQHARVAALTIGTRIKTYAGDVGTVRAMNDQYLTIFFDDGNRKIVLPEHIAAIIDD
ncbi:hypothetical protein FJ365_00145 [Candidatus Dependentiae bacterium]|nr:hypothetical protein [Candidatus Dependentiae bacterium]